MFVTRTGWGFAAFLPAVLCASQASAFDVPAGCAVPPAGGPAGRTLYVDPQKGSDTNNGAQASPWKSIQAAKINGGDSVLLMSGPYGDVKINGTKLASFATVAPAPGQTPVFTTLEILGSSHWIVQGVKVQSMATPDSVFANLVSVSGSANSGPSSDIVLDGINASSIDDASAWTQSDWVNKGRYYAVQVDGRDPKSSLARCVAVTNWTIKNVRNGISAGADDMLVKGNIVKGYGDDGLEFAGNRIVIAGNRITDNHDIGDNNHNDGMQGQPGRGIGGQTVYDSVTIDGNTVIAKETPGLAFPGDLQGIDAFNMDWSNLKVTNNVVVVNAYQGLSFYSVHHGLIANNVVLGTRPDVTTWLDVTDTSHEGSPSNDVIVRNNIATVINLETAAAVADHNLAITMIAWQANGGQFLKTPGVYGDHNQVDPGAVAKLFEAFDIPTATYDLHLKPKSGAIGAGNPVAPNKADGTPRKGPVDLGAY